MSLDKKVEDKKNDLSSYPSFFQSLASEDDNKNEKSFLLCSPLQDNENLSDRDSISDDDKEEIKGGDPSSEQKSPKKRGPYKKGHDSKTKFIEDYIKKPDSPFFSWIFYDPKKDVLLCKICIDAKEKSRNIWGDPEIGCKIFKKYTCERHQESETHLKAVKTIKVVQKTLNIDYFQKSCSGKTKIELEGQFHEEYQNLFKNIIWSVQEELPILKITSLHKHTKESLGLDLPDYHTSTKSSNLIINAISDIITQNILFDIKQCNHIGILIDESTDVSNHEILLIYARFYSKKFDDIIEIFLEAIELKDQKAQTIFDEIKSGLQKLKIWDKIKFLCTDGAPSMSSVKDGVAGKMMMENKLLKSFKCVAHQENLAVKHIYKENEELHKFNRKLFDIIGFFEQSPKKIKILEDIQAELDYEKIYHVIKAKEIRWNSFFYFKS